MLTANAAWESLMARIVLDGEESSPRGLVTREILGKKTCFDMNYPVIVNKARKVGYKFMAAEAAWILSGDNRVATIKKYASEIEQFSDDGIFYFGAYGPRFKDQIRHVLKALETDLSTRQAMLTLWRPNPPQSKDIPCTISLHWIVRDGIIDCFADMRSSDAYLGIPYDWFTFTMMTSYLLLLLRQRGINVQLGTMHFYAHSQHLYEKNVSFASNLHTICQEKAFPPPRVELNGFDTADQLVERLWLIADGIDLTYLRGVVGKKTLEEIENEG